MIIGIHGKMQTGKDTIGEMIQNITAPIGAGVILESNWKIKKFADKLKQILSLLIGIKIEDWEDESIKQSILPSEWNRFKVWLNFVQKEVIYPTEQEAIKRYNQYNEKSALIVGDTHGFVWDDSLTYRKLLQFVGTDLFRDKLHPNVWVNSLMCDYMKLSDWIITDVRFPNEVQAIKDRGGLIIKVEKASYSSFIDSHESEIALNDYTDWDYIIDNNGTLDNLEKNIIEFLKIFNLT